MLIVKIKAFPDGSIDNQTINGATPKTFPIPEGWAVVPDELDTTDFYNYHCFVFLTVETINGVDTVTAYEPNLEAWEAWKASLPDPEPEPEAAPSAEERLAALEEQLAESDAVALALYEAQIEQETVIAEHDEAILGIYEMIGG